ncbi:MAG: PilZ domain-containing protein, partial [Acidobacteriota bacterium]
MPDLIRSVFSRVQTYVQDRRHPPRVRVRLLFTVSLCRNSHVRGLRPECALKGHTRDVSAGGLALNLPQVHLDGHYLADEEREVKLKLELPTGPISMRVIPRRYEKLEQTELGCKYQIGVQISEISDEDRTRYLSFIFPEDLRSVPALKQQIAPEVARRLSAVQKTAAEDVRSLPAFEKEIVPENGQSLGAAQEEIAPEDVRSLPAVEEEIVPENGPSLAAVQTEIAPETEVSYPPIEQEPTREETSLATWWRELAWIPIYQITEISDEDRRRYVRLIAPQGVRSLTAVQKEIAPGNGRSFPAIQNERRFTALQKVIAPENGRSLPAIQKEIVPELEVSNAPNAQDRTRRRVAVKPIYDAAMVVIG